MHFFIVSKLELFYKNIYWQYKLIRINKFRFTPCNFNKKNEVDCVHLYSLK